MQALLNEMNNGHSAAPLSPYSEEGRDALRNAPLDRVALAAKGLAYERLDQLTMEVLLGVR